MTEESEIAEIGEARPDPNALRGPDDHLNPAWIERLRTHLAAGDVEELAEMMQPLHAADAGDVLEALEADERVQLVQLLGEGTFHQFHGGAATGRRLSWQEMHADYREIRGVDHRPPTRRPVYLGELPDAAVGHLERSVAWRVANGWPQDSTQ